MNTPTWIDPDDVMVAQALDHVRVLIDPSGNFVDTVPSVLASGSDVTMVTFGLVVLMAMALVTRDATAEEVPVDDVIEAWMATLARATATTLNEQDAEQ